MSCFVIRVVLSAGHYEIEGVLSVLWVLGLRKHVMRI
jgi:hypothetical protein